ncbi:hypothetical protein [Pararhodobacter sp. SW119]|uniref:hypothetical protein n=1 Tax=Pararhodobacter sp. SW119 TaxID=2780075 RepID=UPI001ADEDF3F|nr:hypothetical protein [Pararhodobacter sp. SW119]
MIEMRIDRRIAESEVDALFAAAFRESVAFCELVRAHLGLAGTGAAERVAVQVPHVADAATGANLGTIDIDVTLAGVRLLIENKISAPWSYAGGAVQPGRYARSGAACGARTVLLAPRYYLARSPKAVHFDYRLSYESLLPTFTGDACDLLLCAIDQAEVPPEYPNEGRTLFFEEIGRLIAQIAPEIRESRKPDRNDDSYTVHLDIPKSLVLHAGLPKPKVFLQLREANVKLMIKGWGRHSHLIRKLGETEGTGMTIRSLPRYPMTLAVIYLTPIIDPETPFESQRDRIGDAIRTTQRLCAWWNRNPDVLRRWQTAIAA